MARFYVGVAMIWVPREIQDHTKQQDKPERDIGGYRVHASASSVGY